MTDPLSRQRSPWLLADDPEIQELLESVGAEDVEIWRRRVHDGELTAIRSVDQGMMHLSVSFARTGRRQLATRYPTWDELAHARYELLPEHLDFVMHLPRAVEYVAVHKTTFHLHEWREQ